MDKDESPTKQTLKRLPNSPAGQDEPGNKRQATGGIAPSGLGMFAGDAQHQAIASLKPPVGEVDMSFVTPLSSPTKESSKDTPNMVFLPR